MQCIAFSQEPVCVCVGERGREEGRCVYACECVGATSGACSIILFTAVNDTSVLYHAGVTYT